MLWLKWCDSDVKTLQMTSINVEIKRKFVKLLRKVRFRIWCIKIYLFIFFRLKNCFYWYDYFIVTSRLVVQVWELGILPFWESNFSGTIINSQTFFWKNPRNDLKEGPVYKAKGTIWPSKLKHISGSVLTKTFETIVLTRNTIIYLTL